MLRCESWDDSKEIIKVYICDECSLYLSILLPLPETRNYSWDKMDFLLTGCRVDQALEESAGRQTCPPRQWCCHPGPPAQSRIRSWSRKIFLIENIFDNGWIEIIKTWGYWYQLRMLEYKESFWWRFCFCFLVEPLYTCMDCTQPNTWQN